MNLTRDKDIPKGSEEIFGEFAGKLQQSVSGDLIEVEYAVYIIWGCAGCVCGPSPFVFIPLKVLAPGTEILYESDSEEEEDEAQQEDPPSLNDANKVKAESGEISDYGEPLETTHNLPRSKETHRGKSDS